MVATAVALTALVPFLAACGGGGKTNAAQPLPSTAPTLTVPGEAKAPKVDNTLRNQSTTTSTSTSTSTAVTPAPTTTTTAPTTGGTTQGGAAPPATGGASPTTGGTSGGTTGGATTTSPAPSTPAGKFEQFCKENPGAC
jgi:hypothetical protein